MMEISISTPMPDDGNCQVIEHLEARPLRARRGWSAEAKARLVEKTLVPGANVSAIARGAGNSYWTAASVQQYRRIASALECFERRHVTDWAASSRLGPRQLF